MLDFEIFDCRYATFGHSNNCRVYIIGYTDKSPKTEIVLRLCCSVSDLEPSWRSTTDRTEHIRICRKTVAAISQPIGQLYQRRRRSKRRRRRRRGAPADRTDGGEGGVGRAESRRRQRLAIRLRRRSSSSSSSASIGLSLLASGADDRPAVVRPLRRNTRKQRVRISRRISARVARVARLDNLPLRLSSRKSARADGRTDDGRRGRKRVPVDDWEE